MRLGQRASQWFETGLARRQLLAVTNKIEARINRLTQHIGEVIEVQGSQVPRSILRTQGAERPGEWILAPAGIEDLQTLEPRPFRQELPRYDAMRQSRIPTLQKADHRVDRCKVRRQMAQEMHRLGRTPFPSATTPPG